MPIDVTCPQCGKSYRVPDDKAGQSGRCACGRVFQVPVVEVPEIASPGPPPMADAGPPPAAEAPTCGPALAGTPGLRCPNCGIVAQFGASECAACGTTLRKQTRTTVVRRPAGVTVLAVVYSAVALLMLFAGDSVTTAGGGALKGFVGVFGPAPGPKALGQWLPVASLAALVLAVFLWRGAGWARLGWRVLLSLHFAFVAGMLGMAVYGTHQPPAALPSGVFAMVLALLFLRVLRSDAVVRYCSR